MSVLGLESEALMSAWNFTLMSGLVVQGLRKYCHEFLMADMKLKNV